MDNSKPEILLVLSINLTVSKSFFDSIRQRVTEIIPALDRYTDYTLEDLCGNKFWNAMDFGRRRKAGRCMAYMVQHGLLPFGFAGRPCGSPKKYRLM